MATAPRSRRAARAAMAGGLLMALGGAVGNAALYLSILHVVAVWLPALTLAAGALGWVLAAAADAGGVTVMVGAFLIRDGHDTGGGVLVGVGSGVNLAAILLGIVAAVLGGPSTARAFAATFLGISGLGLLLVAWSSWEMLPWEWARRVADRWGVGGERRDRRQGPAG